MSFTYGFWTCLGVLDDLSPFDGLGTGGANSEDGQAVVNRRESQLSGRLVLKFLDVGTLEFDDPPARQANEMIVMLMPEDVLVVLGVASEVVCIQQLTVRKDRQGPVECRFRDSHFAFSAPVEKLVGGEVAVIVEDEFQELAARDGEFQTLLAKVGFENLDFVALSLTAAFFIESESHGNLPVTRLVFIVASFRRGGKSPLHEGDAS